MSPRIGPSGPLTRDRIVTVALAAADEVGLEAMTMKLVAGRLGAGVMSLYRHVTDKRELVSAMVDRVLTNLPYPDCTGLNWRETLHAYAGRDWSAYLRHPWLMDAMEIPTQPFSVAVLEAMEWAMGSLDELNLSPAVTAHTLTIVSSYTHGIAHVFLREAVAKEAGEPPWQQRLSAADLSEYPHMAALAVADLPTNIEDWLATGLDVILDGIEVRVLGASLSRVSAQS